MYYESRTPFLQCAICFYRARGGMYHHRVASKVIVTWASDCDFDMNFETERITKDCNDGRGWGHSHMGSGSAGAESQK
jgi:hypothetical protein